MGNIVLPKLIWDPTAASSSRNGHEVDLVVVHRWGVRVSSTENEENTAKGVVNYFKDVRNNASAHVVYGGSFGNYAYQMVAWADLAWGEAAFNPYADEIESSDAIWSEKDESGLHTLASMVAARLLYRNLPPVWSDRKGFCRHADLGIPGGGHLECPTTNLVLWRRFVRIVQSSYQDLTMAGLPYHGWGR